MSDDKAKADQRPITADHVQGAIVGIGSQQNFQGNVTITMRDMAQTIHQSPNADEDAKAELARLMEQLRQQLQQASAEQAPAAQEVANRAEAVVTEATKEQPDKQDVEYQGGRLKQAAEAVKDALPAVLPIVLEIIKFAGKFAI